MDFAVSADHRIKLKVIEKKDEYLDLARESNKRWNMKVTIISITIGAFSIVTKGNGGLGNNRTSGDDPNYYNIENSQNTEKIPGDLRTLAVIQTTVKDHQLTLMRKTLKE